MIIYFLESLRIISDAYILIFFYMRQIWSNMELIYIMRTYVILGYQIPYILLMYVF